MISSKFAVVDKTPDNTAHISVSHNAFFSSGSEKNIFFEFDTVEKNKSKCGLAWSVLLSTMIHVITVITICIVVDVVFTEPNVASTEAHHKVRQKYSTGVFLYEKMHLRV